VREKFIERRFQAKALRVVEQANQIIDDYQDQGFALTLRQLYYQFVARDLMPNTTKSYDYLGWVVNLGRQAGLIDWSAIEDRTRETMRWRSWTSPRDVIEETARCYAEDPWADQPVRPEVWIEKSALVNLIEPACRDWHVPFLACRGYNSLSETYASAKKFQQLIGLGFEPVVLHLGDHDPSGLDMTRDVHDRLDLFVRVSVEVRRLALNMDQVRQYRPPPNPAKESDKRFKDYKCEPGDQSWELDALEPNVIDRLLRQEIESLVDKRSWKAARRGEEKNRDTLDEVLARWGEVEAMVNGRR